MSSVKIAYNEILIYNSDGRPLYASSNISNYDIHPWHTFDFFRMDKLKEKIKIEFPYTINNYEDFELLSNIKLLGSQRFEGFYDNSKNSFIMSTLDDVYNNNEKFIYPIIIYNNDLFIKYDTIDLDKRVVERANCGKCRIIIDQPTEGFFGQNAEEYIWVSNLSKKYNFNKDNMIVITSNMMSNDTKNKLIEDNIIEDNFTVVTYSYFEHLLSFYPIGHIFDQNFRKMSSRDFNNFINSNKTIKKKYHFLCFNRLPKKHRLIIFGELMSNIKFKDKFITSLGKSLDNNKNQFINDIIMYLDSDYEYLDRLLNFFKTYDSDKNYVYDYNDLENNKADSFNKDAHEKAFLNIVTESLTDNNSIFFSEKTFKPICAAQPFIIFGNPNSLKKLKELGYKTFDRWWDESYDEELNFTKRAEKIVKLMEEISSWSLDKCFQVTNEMEDVLTHNFNNLLSGNKILELTSFLLNRDIL